jgi:hypothetical protein
LSNHHSNGAHVRDEEFKSGQVTLVAKGGTSALRLAARVTVKIGEQASIFAKAGQAM